MKSFACRVLACTPIQWLKLKGSCGFKVECISVFLSLITLSIFASLPKIDCQSLSK